MILKQYQTEQMLKHQDMKFEPRLMKSVRQNSKYLLLNCQKVCSIKLITELWCLFNVTNRHSTNKKKINRDFFFLISKKLIEINEGKLEGGSESSKTRKTMGKKLWRSTVRVMNKIIYKDHTWNFFNISNNRFSPVSAIFLSVCRNAHIIESITSFSCWNRLQTTSGTGYINYIGRAVTVNIR